MGVLLSDNKEVVLMSFCSSCGNEIKDEHNFCQKCGHNSNNNRKFDNYIERIDSKESSIIGIVNSKTNVSKKLLILVFAAVLVGAGLLIFMQTMQNSTVGRNESRAKTFNANASSAVDIANWLISQGYCKSINESNSIFDWEKKLISDELIADCDDKGTRYTQRQGLNTDYPVASGLRFYINVGAGRFDSIGNKVRFEKSLNIITGNNWVIDVNTDEVAFPGSYDDAKGLMKVISDELGGSLSSDYQPQDYCTMITGYINIMKNEVKNYKLTPDENASASECKKYFPQVIGIDIYGN